MKTRLKCFAVAATLALLGFAPAPADQNEPSVQRPKFNFTLVPKPFQKNPQLEMTVFTELTDFGRKQTAVSPEEPVRFVVHVKGAMSMGMGVGNERLPSQEELEAVLYSALEARGFLPATEDGPVPRFVLIFHWGSHYGMDLELAGLFPELQRQHVLERSMLVGGHAFKKEIARMFDFGPLPKDRTPKMSALFNQASSNLYYAVVSAYDFESVAHDTPRLAWRTTMTVTSSGVAMEEALPPLVMTASDFFGREMAEPSAIWRHVRRGTVEMGPLRYIGEVDESDLPESK
ncbi:MAG TPA: hypothetical protein VIK52_09210 [Opitutaceae bacterium]